MKQRLIKFAARIDAMSLRERGMVFAATAGVIIFWVFYILLKPMYASQALLLAELSQQRNNVAGIEAEMTGKVQAYANDPNAATNARLAQVQAEMATLSASLRATQRELVPPERIVPLLESMLRANGRLRMVCLTTLPVTGLNGAPSAAPKDDKAAAGKADASTARPADLLYRHGVELVVQGSYLDMVSYMSALEHLPTQLYWGKAKLEVDQYPTARLSLTLYTMSLEPKWIKL